MLVANAAHNANAAQLAATRRNPAAREGTGRPFGARRQCNKHNINHTDNAVNLGNNQVTL
jgi:hypothetical protein